MWYLFEDPTDMELRYKMFNVAGDTRCTIWCRTLTEILDCKVYSTQHNIEYFIAELDLVEEAETLEELKLLILLRG